jgi:hypothetical protein
MVMLLQTFSKTIIYLSFKINQDYIAKNLCENRGAPEKHCCGKCQLEKRMKQDEQNQNSIPSSLKNFDEIVLLNEKVNNPNLISFFSSEILFCDSIEKVSSAKPSEIFHPPSFA